MQKDNDRMIALTERCSAKRYKIVTEKKAGGATYTPFGLATFVAEQIVRAATFHDTQRPIHVLDPAVGDGALLLSLLSALQSHTRAPIVVFGFDTNPTAIDQTSRRLREAFPDVKLRLKVGDFLEYALNSGNTHNLFSAPQKALFDLIIANPPYVRTQIMGAQQAQSLASSFNLTGRVDLYHVFLIAMAQVLKPSGTAGIVVSNRFMTTKGGASVRAALRERFTLRHIWDLGDTKLFDAAVLPAVILAEGRNGQLPSHIGFSSIYETSGPAAVEVSDPIEAIANFGNVGLPDGRRFYVQHGNLHDTESADSVWRIATETSDAWLATVAAHSWGIFRDIGKIRVGVKTCADKIFIRSNWSDKIELLRPLTTHHDAARFRSIPAKKPQHILYPHEIQDGRRQAVDISLYPKSKAYLEAHRQILEDRTYVTEGGRQWYEIWVPQDPAAWGEPKLVFRDISAKPTFWLDLDGTIVNGDCYWIVAKKPELQRLLWLAAAVANSTFAEAFYDHRFNNKLYAGRRRFMSQYVEQFPLPDPATPLSREIITATKAIYHVANTPEAEGMETRINAMVWEAFGFSLEEVTR